MHRQLVGLIGAVTVIAALVVGGVATAEKPVTTAKGNIHAEFDARFSPKTLLKKKRTPTAFAVSAKLKTPDGSHLPPMKRFVFEGDEDTSISVKGIPLCESGIRSQRLTPPDVRERCREAMVGSGNMRAEIKFPDQKPIPAISNLMVINGGVKQRVTTLYLHAYITVPTPVSIVTTVKIKRVSKGRYGWQATGTIPKIAGGSGSVTSLGLTLRRGILSAKCSDGRLYARATAVFGSILPKKLNSPMVMPCTGKVSS